MDVTRDQVLGYRVRAQQLDRDPPSEASTGADVLDLGVQDSGGDGARWALELRGFAPPEEHLFTAWTVRGAPHVYRRAQAASVAAAVAPWSEADAAKRVFDAAKPLRAAGIEVLDALDHIAAEMESILEGPLVKGDLSGALNDRLPHPYLRHCRPCATIHLYEQPFRLSALRAGLELRPGTSPPVLEPIPGWSGMAAERLPALDPVRAYLHLFGPSTAKQVADYIDAPVKDVRARWPEDVETVSVEGTARDLLVEDVAALPSRADHSGVVRLLGPFDLFLQGRDRELHVADPQRRKDLWRTLGRPGAVLVGHEIRGTWRPRASGSRLRLAVQAWTPLPDLEQQAERLAGFRGLVFDGFVES